MTQQIDKETEDNRWYSFLMRLRKEAEQSLKNNKDGACILRVVVAMDSQGNLIAWLSPKVAAKVEPAKFAALGMMGEVEFLE